MTRFLDLCQSPYLNRHKDVYKLVQYLSKVFPAFSESKMQERTVFDCLWPGDTFSKAKLHHVLSYTSKTLELFFKLESIFQDDFHFEASLLKSYRNRNLNKRYENSIKRLGKDLEAYPFRNSDYHFNMLSLKTEADKYFLNQQKYLRDESLQERVNHLDLYFLAEKLKSSCEMINRELFFNMNYEHRFLNETIVHIEENLDYYQQFPSIAFYYRVYQSLTEPKETQHYFRLREMIESSGKLFPKEERKDLYFYAYNYCLRKVNKGEVSFLREAFELMKDLLTEGHLFENETLSEWHYKNLSTLGLRLNEKEWTRNFIESYKGRLPDSVAENAYTYNLALYYFKTQQYDQALVLLNTVEYTDIVYNLDAKTLLLRIYFEVSETASLLALSEAFKKYIARNKTIAETKHERYLNFFKHCTGLYRIKESVGRQSWAKTKKELRTFKEQLETEKNIPNKLWLTSKYDELAELSRL